MHHHRRFCIKRLVFAFSLVFSFSLHTFEAHAQFKPLSELIETQAGKIFIESISRTQFGRQLVKKLLPYSQKSSGDLVSLVREMEGRLLADVQFMRKLRTELPEYFEMQAGFSTLSDSIRRTFSQTHSEAELFGELALPLQVDQHTRFWAEQLYRDGMMRRQLLARQEMASNSLLYGNTKAARNIDELVKKKDFARPADPTDTAAIQERLSSYLPPEFLSKGIQESAQNLKITEAELLARLDAHRVPLEALIADMEGIQLASQDKIGFLGIFTPKVKKVFSESWRKGLRENIVFQKANRQIGTENFWKFWVTMNIAQIASTTAGQYFAKGDKIFDEQLNQLILDLFTFNIAENSLIWIMMRSGSKSMRGMNAYAPGVEKRMSSAFSKPIAKLLSVTPGWTKSYLKDMKQDAPSLFKTGMGAGLVGGITAEVAYEFQIDGFSQIEDLSLEERAARIFWNSLMLGSYFSIHSNVRYQFITRFSNRMGRVKTFFETKGATLLSRYNTLFYKGLALASGGTIAGAAFANASFGQFSYLTFIRDYINIVMQDLTVELGLDIGIVPIDSLIVLRSETDGRQTSDNFYNELLNHVRIDYNNESLESMIDQRIKSLNDQEYLNLVQFLKNRENKGLPVHSKYTSKEIIKHWRSNLDQ